ncbi:PEP-CTERM protein-sorting domain-containing protein [Rubritalea squalenifaciens DSM 18772]|uniref:PEP-CTERM protein-sorting domain-containing protein n=1 Tax=Rubritalea squalenifaciens DSM 18772 TaxID=1123071 RepID=A0A1M6KWA6_9BACT|nr:PEP-CTERM sorting domain-containing protein [Rubritalea squalenifaciens]SHJ63209.1 PEP-CTERM protein-sorting domain-containing protein [Rubritalea squalenifaciens DSM 18772]
MKTHTLYAAAILGLVSTGNLMATTIILGNAGSGTNTNIPDTFGDNVSASDPGRFEVTDGGTPNIGLTWDASGGTNANSWQFHGWGGSDYAAGGALQMDGSSTNSIFSITFTPEAGFGVVLNGFDFVGDTNNDTYQYRVDLVRTFDNNTVFTTTTAEWTTDTSQPQENAPSVTIDYTGALGEEYRLDLVRLNDDSSDTGSRVDIAIDNLSFGQTAIPEPTSTALVGLGAFAFVLRRRR